jgi:hypothetical protein
MVLDIPRFLRPGNGLRRLFSHPATIVAKGR